MEVRRTISFQGAEQINTACAPLVGTPLENNLSDGALHVSFRNIFSVVELRIDAGELESPARSISVEPASEEGFEGWLTFTGTVDPETLALTPAPDGTGTKLTLDFPEGADLTKPQTIKFPVGRFTSPAGLKLTLTTADDKTYTKNVYKSGIRTYNEKDGVFSARHLAKALYAFAPPGGIWTADDLVEFAAAVNAGETLAPWQNEEGVVVLLDDIDMTGVTTWTPIGDATFALASNALTISSGRPFTGFFDGQDHTISNFRMVCDNATPNRAWGLFGALGPGAVVENLVFDSSCSLEITASKATDCGILAGLVYDAAVRNVTNEAPMSFDGSAGNVRMTMGMIGLAFANEGIVLDRLTNEADLTAENGGNSKSDATGVQIGGICGFSTNHASSANAVAFTACVNRGNLTTKVGRASGIVAAANRYTHLTDCANYGNNFNEFATAGGARIGNITCITGTGAKFTKVVNRGDVICKNEGCCGSIVCLVNHDDNEFVGCENYGRVISDRDNNKYKGSFFGQCNKAAVFRNCIAQGDVGTYNDGNYVMVGINADNYMDYLGTHSAAAVNVTRENILYYPAGSTTPAEATFNVAPGSVETERPGNRRRRREPLGRRLRLDRKHGRQRMGEGHRPERHAARSGHEKPLRPANPHHGRREPADRAAVRNSYLRLHGPDADGDRIGHAGGGWPGLPEPVDLLGIDSRTVQYPVECVEHAPGHLRQLGLHLRRARRGQCRTGIHPHGQLLQTRRLDDGRGRLLALHPAREAARSRHGRGVRRHDGRRSQFAQILHRGVSRRRCLEERRRGPAHRTRRPFDPLHLQVLGHSHGKRLPARQRHADRPFRDPVTAASANPLPRRGTLHLLGRYAEHLGEQFGEPTAAVRILGLATSRTSARRSRATRRRCSASATRSPITAIRRGCSKRSPGTRDITSMSKGTSRVRRISGSIWSCRSRPTPSTSEATITPSFRTRARIPRPTGATAQRR